MNMNTKEKVKAIEKKLLIFLNKYTENTQKDVKKRQFNFMEKRSVGKPKR